MALISYFESLTLSGFLNCFPSGAAQGLIWGIMALGVYITFRILNIADLSVDGTFTTGGAIAVMMIMAGFNPFVACISATLAGMLAGFVTGLLHTMFGIPAILAGILTQYALWSINLAIMGMKANQAISVDRFQLILSSRYVNLALGTGLVITMILIALLYLYFGTEQGSAIRATGCNAQMAKANGISINKMTVLGLSLSNGIVAFSGSLMAQFQGYADINMGRGSIVIGLAAVIIGEVLGDALFGKKMNFALRLTFIASGGVIYYILVKLVLWLKLDTNYLKLLTAVIVAIFLAVPYIQNQRRASFKKAGKNAQKVREG
ncbi:ABC transporter permease [Butyrivibrio sp. MC2013]|uniref:ABC transporter permease n=1 Tax=Butyrivibrio sp. MC2013 TaxID=1280686 RepID=UPI000422FB6E|nr:ABC transporter permease [Butyrivibrio sp. MC2013]